MIECPLCKKDIPIRETNMCECGIYLALYTVQDIQDSPDAFGKNYMFTPQDLLEYVKDLPTYSLVPIWMLNGTQYTHPQILRVAKIKIFL